MGYAVRIGSKAVEVVTGGEEVLVSSGQASGVKKKWGGGELRARARNGSASGSRVVQQGSGWVVEKDSPYGGSPYSSPAVSPFVNGNGSAPGTPGFGPPSGFGPASPNRPPSISSPSLHPRSPSYGASPYTPRSPYMPSSLSRSTSGNDSTPQTPAAGYAQFPPTPGPNSSSGFGLGLGLNGNGNGNGSARSLSNGSAKKDD